MTSHGLPNWIRQPEYTGENRCTPCTALNIAIALAAAAVVALYWIPAGVGVFAVSLLVIYFRGYLIPGTPTITKQYFPDSVLRLFDKAEPGSVNHSPVDESDGADGSETLLTEANAVEPCTNEDDLCLVPEFETVWNNRIERIKINGTERSALKEMVNADREVTISEQDDGPAISITADNKPIGYWESRAAFLADIGAAAELSERYDGWSALTLQERNQAVSGLRIFLNRCPVCNGAVTMSEETVESCCRAHEVIAVSCTNCNSHLFEVASPEAR